MADKAKDTSDWDRAFAVRWRDAIKREFGTGNVAAHRLAQAGLNPATVKAWTSKGGCPTMANLCLVARAARDPSAFIVEVCGDEPWAQELAVGLQRRRLDEAEKALAITQASHGSDALGVLRQLAGPRRSYWYATDARTLTAPQPCADAAARPVVVACPPGAGSLADCALRQQGWILIEASDDRPLIATLNVLSVTDGAIDAVLDWLRAEPPRAGLLLRMFLTDWVDAPCATLVQIEAELQRVRILRDHADRATADDPAPSDEPYANGPTSEQRPLDEAPQAGSVFHTVWARTGGVVDAELLHNLRETALFDMCGVYAVWDGRFRVSYVGPSLRLPHGVQHDRVIGQDVLDIQGDRGFGPMIAAHFAKAAEDCQPLVHKVQMAPQRDYRRISFPMFGPNGRTVVGVIGFSDARRPSTAD